MLCFNSHSYNIWSIDEVAVPVQKWPVKPVSTGRRRKLPARVGFAKYLHRKGSVCDGERGTYDGGKAACVTQSRFFNMAHVCYIQRKRSLSLSRYVLK